MILKLVALLYIHVLGYSIIEGTSSKFPSDEDCGEVSIATRVIGGKPAQHGKFPWLVSLGRPTFSTFTHDCGGTLITKEHVITAAHCFNERAVTHVRVGEYDRSSEYDGIVGTDYPILKHIDPGYDPDTHENDISLVYLLTPVIYNDFVKPACLPFHLRQEPFSRGKLRLVGWGRIDPDAEFGASIPFYADIPVLKMSRCRSSYLFTDFVLDDRQICYGTKGLASCRGDSGSPLMYMDRKKSKLIVVGLPSVGACGVNYKPSFATKITKFLDWITINVEKTL